MEWVVIYTGEVGIVLALFTEIQGWGDSSRGSVLPLLGHFQQMVWRLQRWRYFWDIMIVNSYMQDYELWSEFQFLCGVFNLY